MPLSLLSVLFVYEATQWEFPAWRGLAPSKNWLGQIVLISILIWSRFWSEKSLVAGWVGFVPLLLSVVLLIGSGSATSILALLIVIAIALLAVIERRFSSLGVGRTLTFVFAITVAAFLLVAVSVRVDIGNAFFSAVGKDSAFSERVYLWHDVIEIARHHLLFGCGFDGFWIVDNLAVQQLYREYVGCRIRLITAISIC